MSTTTSSASPPLSSANRPQPYAHYWGSVSPANSSSSSFVSSKSVATGSSKPRPKPANVFSSDGSFLERFQKMKKEEEDKKKAEEVAQRKLAFQDRFKRRGKRPASEPSTVSTSDEPLSKRMKRTPSSDTSSESASASPSAVRLP